MKNLWFPLAAIALFATTVIVEAQVNATKGPRITPHKEAAPKKQRVEATFEATKGPNVDWSYLRVNHPAAVASAIDLVKRGEAEITTLSGLAGTPSLMKVRGGGSAPPKGLDPLLKPGAGASGLLKSAPGTLRSYLPMESSPRAAHFGNVVDGQRVQKAVYVRNAPAGTFKASVESKSPFRIVSLQALDGKVSLTKATQWEGSLVRTGQFELPSALKSHASTSPSIKGGAGVSNPGLASILKGPSIRDTRPREATSAPFELISDEGTSFRIIVEFAPKWSFNGDPVGNHEGRLKLTCGDDVQIVDLRARFEGVNVGVIAIPESREFTILASPKYEKHPSGGNMVIQNQRLGFTVPLTLINTKEATEFRVWASQEPEGVSYVRLYPEKDTVPAGTSTFDAYFEVRYRGDGYSGASLGAGQDVVLNYSAHGIDRQIPITLNILPDMRSCRLSKVWERMRFDLEVILQTDNYVDFLYSIMLPTADPPKITITFYVGNETVFEHPIHPKLEPGLHQTLKGEVRRRMPAIKGGWEQLLAAPYTFRITVD